MRPTGRRGGAARRSAAALPPLPPEGAGDTRGIGGVRPGLALLAAGALFMEILDATVIAPAAPHIGASFGVPAVAVNVAVTGYVLTLAVLIPISGWLADRFGARLVFASAIGVFTAASAACALATSLPMLTATRVVQGIGGAMMVPVGRLVVLRTTRKEDLVAAIAYLTWPALAAPVVAPGVGGVLSTYATWRWIFVINLPLGAVALFLALRLVPPMRTPGTGRLDWPGFVLTAVGVAALVVGLESLGATRPDAAIVTASLSVAAVALGAAVRYLLRAPRPLLDLRILRTATYRATAFGGSAFRAVMAAIPFLLPLFFQLGFGWTAAKAGAFVIALFAGNLGIKPVTTPMLRRYGIRGVMLSAIAGSALCLAGIALLQPSTALPLLAGVLFLSGVARSVGFTTYNTVAFADVPAERMPSANALMAAVQELGTGLGVAVGALLVRVGRPLSEATGLSPGGGTAFRVAFVLLAVVLVLPTVEALRLPRTAGAVLTARR